MEENANTTKQSFKSSIRSSNIHINRIHPLKTKISMIRNYAKDILNEAISRAEMYQDNITSENLKIILTGSHINEN